jgi:hypothetical protein
LKDAEQTRLSQLRAKADNARATENKKILEQSQKIIQQSLDQQLGGSKN